VKSIIQSPARKTDRLPGFVKCAIMELEIRRMKRRTRTNDPAGMRNRVLDVAALAFQTRGFGATSTHDIVRAAGVTGGALHHHFPTKKALVLAVIGERVSSEVGQTWVARMRDAPSAADGILSAFDNVIATLDAQGSVSGCPLGNLALELSLADEDLRAALAGEYGKWRDAIAEKLRTDIARGQAGFAASDPGAFANVVVAMFSGAMAISKTEQNSAALAACAAQLAATMNGGVAAR
jgi:AcrR family transcriptional regulator